MHIIKIDSIPQLLTAQHLSRLYSVQDAPPYMDNLTHPASVRCIILELGELGCHRRVAPRQLFDRHVLRFVVCETKVPTSHTRRLMRQACEPGRSPAPTPAGLCRSAAAASLLADLLENLKKSSISQRAPYRSVGPMACARWSMSTILTARRQLSWPVEAGKEFDCLRC